MKLKHIVLSLVLITSTGLSAEQIDLAEQLWQSHLHQQRIPLVSSRVPNLSVEQAYLVQRDYVNKRLADDKLAGFKAGLTSSVGQQKFNVNQPLAGILFGSGDLTGAELIQLSHFKRLMLETELGFEIGKPITDPISNTAELKQSIQAVFPVIELPDLGFIGKPTGVDIIAANVGSAAFIKGKPFFNVTDLDLNSLTVTLTRNGDTVNVGQGAEALGDQWQAALWLVNTIVAQGRTLEPGQFFITGVMGNMISAKPGEYLADFGPLGTMSFSVK
jgi:2-keto-4-pentenoate hydratase